MPKDNKKAQENDGAQALASEGEPGLRPAR